jgi:hypothetical protein
VFGVKLTLGQSGGEFSVEVLLTLAKRFNGIWGKWGLGGYLGIVVRINNWGVFLLIWKYGFIFFIGFWDNNCFLIIF